MSGSASAAFGAFILITDLTTHSTREGHVAIFASPQCLDKAWHGIVTQEIFNNMVNELSFLEYSRVKSRSLRIKGKET